jgi:tRNA U34 5-carboxymethylaminomethyl modifying GTPase MnmE/TrmE
MQTLTEALRTVETHLQDIGEAAHARHLSTLRTALVHSDLCVVVFGEFNRGKSTLINALLVQPGGSNISVKHTAVGAHRSI